MPTVHATVLIFVYLKSIVYEKIGNRLFILWHFLSNRYEPNKRKPCRLRDESHTAELHSPA